MSSKGVPQRQSVVISEKVAFIDPATKRTTKAFQLLQYNYVVLPLSFAAVHLCVIAPAFNTYLRSGWVKSKPESWDVGSYICLMLLILSQFTIVGISLMAMYPFQPNRWKNGPRLWNWDRLLICLVTKGDNIEAIQRALSNMEQITALDERIQFHLLIEEHSKEKFQSLQGGNISITTVPASYSPIKATHKARALEYFRMVQMLTSKDWVLHLDEETLIDTHVAQTCIDFMERRKREMQMAAQGIIMYNSYRYWDNWLLTAADIIRVIDDFGHFQFQLNCLGKALDGFHGSFLLLNGRAENTITWETDSLVEDMYFGLKASELGFQCSWLPSFAREQSPFSIKDYLSQRRRWYTGTWALNRFHLRVLFIMWVMMPLELVFWPVWVWLGLNGGMPSILFDIAVFDISLQLAVYGLATCLQDYHAGMSFPRILFHFLLVILLLPFIHLLEFSALVFTIVSPPKGFDTITK